MVVNGLLGRGNLGCIGSSTLFSFNANRSVGEGEFDNDRIHESIETE